MRLLQFLGSRPTVNPDPSLIADWVVSIIAIVLMVIDIVITLRYLYILRQYYNSGNKEE